MAVNTLVTGLIVFKILKVFLEVKSTSVERTLPVGSLSSLSSTGGAKLRHIIFIIIESGMALFAIQLVRIVLSSIPMQTADSEIKQELVIGLNLVLPMHQMLNVIIRSVHFYFFCFADDIYLARASHQQ